jgi:lysophospholipase L1-like esterase
MKYGLRERPFFERLFYQMHDYSQIAAQIAVALQMHNDVRQGPSRDLPTLFEWCREPWSERTRRNVEASMNTLRELIKELKARNIVPVITAVPHLPHFTGEYSMTPLTVIQAVAEESGAPFFDLYHAIASAPEPPASYYYRKDMHFNERGYSRWAEKLSTFLEPLLRTRVDTVRTDT